MRWQELEITVRILIVEDEPKTGEYLRQGLSEAGFVVDLATNGPDGIHLAKHGAHDLVILDVMLPGLNGWQVLSTLRQQGLEMPGRPASNTGAPSFLPAKSAGERMPDDFRANTAAGVLL